VVPEAPHGRRPEYETSVRMLGKAGPLEPMADLSGRWQYETLRPARSLTMGAYTRAHKNLKLGLFWRVQSGMRHDDDWVNPAPGVWEWRNTFNRPEQVLVLDASPRVMLPFLPGGKWTGSLKVRYEHNFFNSQRSLKLEPELAWFWMEGLNPVATVFARYEHYKPLNFGERGKFYERWWYLAGLWHANPDVSLGPSVALRDELWTASTDYRTATNGGSYKSLWRSWMLGFTVVLRAH
jgi:outer membrane receptor protein involved in Fe transport